MSFNIIEVEVKYCESIYKQSVSLALLHSVFNLNIIVNICSGPLTPALRLPITVSDRPSTEGTTALYFTEGGNSDKVLGLTCHHILFKIDRTTNDDNIFVGTGAPHHIMVEIYEGQIKRLEAMVGGGDVAEAIEDLEKCYEKIKKEWRKLSQHIINYICFSFTITFNSAFELNDSNFKNVFKGDFIDLGTEIPSNQFTLKMYLHDDGKLTFEYLDDHLLSLHDMIIEECMHEPDMLDHDNEACLLIIKNGNTTDVTISKLMKWAIYNYDNKSSMFSASDDSGLIISMDLVISVTFLLVILARW
ncbi:uncharacterized protein LAESUDRAFT_763199 [Laetiporus sulphureus 93-53]|uniref:Uncharacterized protein n=1 Tax=Laetiporus sulphureus 93-53 TaxID=1314785 RepID=A0A165C2P7_9APHY|nr:uncharacterized protein LAESUDRAFT_763199 [Laetiporus sulphureus 93-53]KZT02093.1 hypothetical protein LAESUDRAFT_763199 [Laetiporus sulphureus 93-53]